MIILNPASGSGRAANFLELLQELPGNPIVRITTRPGEGKDLAREATAQGYQTIVAAGGDGLINEVVNGLIDSLNRTSFPHENRLLSKLTYADEVQDVSGAEQLSVQEVLEGASTGTTKQFAKEVEFRKKSNIRLGILPLGTMNVFASELRIPLHSVEEAWSVILEQHIQHVDLPCVIDLENKCKHYFIQLAGIGLDAQILLETSREAKQIFGPISYLLTFLNVALRKPPKIFLHCEETGKKYGSFLLLGNGKFYGGTFPFFSEGSLHDGLLHVLLFKHHNFLELLGNIPGLLLGRARELPTVKYFKTTSIVIEPRNPSTKIPFELDGEMIAYLPIQVTLEKNKLPVIVPKQR